MNCHKKEEFKKEKMDIARRPSLPATAGVTRQWRQHAASSDPRLFSGDTGGCVRFSMFGSKLSAFLRPITAKELRRFAVAELSDALMPTFR